MTGRPHEEARRGAKMRHYRAMIAILMIASLMMVGCGGKTGTATGDAIQDKAQGPIKIGATLPLTGEATSLGTGIKDGIELAVKEINDAGGVNGRKINVIYEDDKCGKDGATTITKLTSIDNVDSIIGPLCSSAGGPGLPIAQQSGTPSVIFASAPHLTKIGDYIFRIYPSDAFAGRFNAEYAYDKLGKRTAAIVYVKNDYGQGLHDTFKQRYTELGGKILVDEGVAQEETDLRTTATKVAAAEPEIVFTPMYPAAGLILMKQLKEAGNTAPVLGTDSFEAEEFVKPSASDGVYYTTARFGNPDDFKARLKAQLGKESSVWTPLGYDAVRILADAFSKAGTDKKAVRDALAKESFKGVSSPLIEFDENGDLKAVQYDVKTIKNGKSEVVLQ